MVELHRSSLGGIVTGSDIARSLQQEGQRVFAGLLDLEREQFVGASPPEIDGSNRFSSARGRLDEAKTGIDHQGRADDQHGVRLGKMVCRSVEPIAGNVLAEEHDVRLEHSTAMPARWHNK